VLFHLTYPGSYRFGVVSIDYSVFVGSYRVVGAPQGPRVPYDGGSLWQGTGVQPQAAIDWAEIAQLNRGNWGVRYAYPCPPAPPGTLSGIWGSTLYTDDSPICVAGAHAGVITRDGGTVVVEMVPGVSSYSAANRNGIQSSAFGAYGGSILVIP
jgi:hypothetical protein